MIKNSVPRKNAQILIVAFLILCACVLARPSLASLLNVTKRSVPSAEISPSSPQVETAFIRVLPVLASDLIYDPLTQTLYASSPSRAGATGNSVVPINPMTGTLGTPIFVGSEPSRLARSDNGQYLYVGLDGSSAVRRIDLATQTADLQFSLGTSATWGTPNLVSEIEVAPGNAHEVAVSLRNTCCSPSHEGVAIFDDGVLRGPVSPSDTRSNVIEFSSSATTLYGLDTDTSGQWTFRKMNVTPTGVVSVQASQPFNQFGSKMKFDAGRMYFNNGVVIDPNVPTTTIGTFPNVTAFARLVLPDSSVGRTFFVDGTDLGEGAFPSTVQILGFDQTSFLSVGSVSVAGVLGSVRGFVRWGNNGLAFCTAGGQVFLIQSNLVAPTTPAPTPTPTPSPTPSPSPIPTPGVGELRQITLTTNDLVVDPNGQTIFATVPSNASVNPNTLTPIEPVSGALGTAIPVGNNPNKLAISNDGSVMYASLDGSNSVRRIDVATRQPNLEFSLGSDPVSGPYQAEDIAVAPNHPETLAVARLKPTTTPRHGGVVVFDNGIVRSGALPAGAHNRIEFSNSPEVLYGQNNDDNFNWRFSRIGLSSCGLFTLTSTQNLFRGFGVDFKVDNGRAYASDGRVIDPETATPLGVLKLRAVDDLFAPPALIAPEAKARRIYYLVNDLGQTILRVFDTATFVKVGELLIPGVSGTTSSLVRWGTNGLAFRTSTGQVFVLQNNLIGGQDPEFSPAPIPVTPTTQVFVHVATQSANVSDATITFSGGLSASGMTDASGNFTLTNVPLCVGDITVTPSKPNYTFSPVSTTVNNPINANLQFAATIPTIGLLAAATDTTPESVGKVVYLVSRTFTLSVGASSVEYETIPGTASDRSDFNATTGTIQFGPNETFKIVSVLVTDDALVEGTESFTIRLKNPVNAQLSPTNSSVVVSIIDNDSDQNAPNPLSNAQFFVRQHYQDFLNRFAPDDPSGFDFWTNEITMCISEADSAHKAACLEAKRINVSAAFFLSIEFQQTGFLVHRLYTSSYPVKPARPLGLPRMSEFQQDTQAIGSGLIVGAPGWEQKLEQNTQTFLASWVQRSEFLAEHPMSQTAAQFVDSLFQNNGVTPLNAERSLAIQTFGSGDIAGRAAALRSVAESQSVTQHQKNSAFVLAQYFGYLRRNPDDAPDGNFDGYQFWLNKLNDFNGDFVAAEMVKAFLVSTEYQQRFGKTNFVINQ